MRLDHMLIGAGIAARVLLAAYYLLIRTEGMYLGWRVVVWLYDVYASRYDGIKKYDRGYEEWFLAHPIIDALRDVRAPLVLDVATGTGRVPLILLEQDAFQGRVIGLDLSRQMLFRAAVKLYGFRRRADLIWHTAMALPFPDDTFDMVTCIEGLEFLPHPKENLGELVRVLRPGGVLLITNRKGTEARLMPGRTRTTPGMVAFLSEELGLIEVRSERWQVEYDLVWAKKPGESRPTGARPLAEVLRCPVCGAVEMLPLDSGEWVCGQCERRALVGEDGVLELFAMTQAHGRAGDDHKES